MPAPKLTNSEILEGLKPLNSWKVVGDKIERKLEFTSFMEAIAFINRVAPLADKADHHPELFNVYNRVEIALTTHDSGGLTHKDLSLAAAIDSVSEH